MDNPNLNPDQNQIQSYQGVLQPQPQPLVPYQQVSRLEQLVREAKIDDVSELEEKLGSVADILYDHIDILDKIIDEEIGRVEKRKKSVLWFAKLIDMVDKIKECYESGEI